MGSKTSPCPPSPPPQYLRAVARAAAPFGGDCMFYLAAAVSDFYIPWASLVGPRPALGHDLPCQQAERAGTPQSRQRVAPRQHCRQLEGLPRAAGVPRPAPYPGSPAAPHAGPAPAAASRLSPPWPPSPAPQAEHKIQSADGPLALNLSKVPKMLGVLRHVWAPGAFVVSFKLETDERILLDKVCARGGGYSGLGWAGPGFTMGREGGWRRRAFAPLRSVPMPWVLGPGLVRLPTLPSIAAASLHPIAAGRWRG
jgi:hypothetical protein